MSHRTRPGSPSLPTAFVAIVLLVAALGVWLPSSAVRADSLNGPRELGSETSADYTLDMKCLKEPNLSVGKKSGSWVVDQSVAKVVWTETNPIPVVRFTAPAVADDTVVTLSLGCLVGSTTTFTKKVIVTAVLVPGPPQETFADLVFIKDETAAMSSVKAKGNLPCPGGTITSSNLVVLPGSGRWEIEPTYSVQFGTQNAPLLQIASIGRPIFDGVSDRETTVGATIICAYGAGRIIYRGDITVTNTTSAAEPPNSEPPVASNVRGAISVDPAQVTEGQLVTISNTTASPCRDLIFPYGASGFDRGDDRKFEFSISKGSEAGDLFRADASGNWAVSIRFDDGFLAGQDVRRLTVTFACGTRVNNQPSINFVYQPAALSVVASGTQAPASTAGSGAGAPATTAGSTGGTPDTGSVDPQTGTPVDPQSGGVAAPSTLGGFSIPSGESVDAAGDQILPRAYLNGETQQLIEIATGLVIGEYDLVSGQFVDPNTGAVTGIVDPATGELIDAATGIQIGISTTPPSASDGAALLGLGDGASSDEATDDSGSNTLVIVLIAVAGALLLAVIALVVSRRKKPTLPPPPIA